MKTNTVIAIVIPADEDRAVTIEPIVATLDNLQSIVGGYLEGVTRNGAVAYMNDEGKLEGLPTNPRATRFLLDQRMIFPFDLIAGNVVITGADEDGNETDVPADFAMALGELLGL